MIQELLYTSAPKGLKPGSRGFCTVLSTSGMPAPIATALESLSGYRPVYPPGDPQAKLNPVVYSHLKMSLGGRRSDVLSRVADYGLDYSQRTNKIAHHLVVDSNDRPPAGPAWLLAHPDVMRTNWEGEPHIVSGERQLPNGKSEIRVCSHWKEMTGDAGWAGVLAESFLKKPDQPAYIVFSPGMNLLPLIEEALALLPASKRWDVSFSTYFTKVPNGVTCNWRCVLADSPEAKESRRYVQSLRIDLTEPLGPATGGELVEIARTGRAHIETVQEPADATTSKAKSTPHETPPTAGAAPPLRARDGRPVPIPRKRASNYPVGHTERSNEQTAGSWFNWAIAITMLVLLAGGGTVAMKTGWKPLSIANVKKSSATQASSEPKSQDSIAGTSSTETAFVPNGVPPKDKNGSSDSTHPDSGKAPDGRSSSAESGQNTAMGSKGNDEGKTSKNGLDTEDKLSNSADRGAEMGKPPTPPMSEATPKIEPNLPITRLITWLEADHTQGKVNPTDTSSVLPVTLGSQPTISIGTIETPKSELSIAEDENAVYRKDQLDPDSKSLLFRISIDKNNNKPQLEIGKNISWNDISPYYCEIENASHNKQTANYSIQFTGKYTTTSDSSHIKITGTRGSFFEDRSQKHNNEAKQYTLGDFRARLAEIEFMPINQRVICNNWSNPILTEKGSTIEKVEIELSDEIDLTEALNHHFKQLSQLPGSDSTNFTIEKVKAKLVIDNISQNREDFNISAKVDEAKLDPIAIALLELFDRNFPLKDENSPATMSSTSWKDKSASVATLRNAFERLKNTKPTLFKKEGPTSVQIDSISSTISELEQLQKKLKTAALCSVILEKKGLLKKEPSWIPVLVVPNEQ